MLDCASVASITALRHFRRPDVTVIGEEVTIVSRIYGRCYQNTNRNFAPFMQHSMTERVPVPLAIHHTPICLTFAFFGETYVVA